VVDQLGDSSTGTVAVTVDAGPELAAGSVAKVAHGRAVQAGTVAAGVSGDVLTLATTSAGRGTLILAKGVLTYAAPTTGGADSIGYTVTGTFSTAVDGGPMAKTGTLLVGHGQAADLTSLLTGLVAPGLPGDTETLTAVSAKAGAASLANQVASYTAPASGTDTVSYTVTDQLREAATGTVRVTVDTGPVVKAAAVAKVGHGQTVQAGAVAPGGSGDVFGLATIDAGRGALSLVNGVLSYTAPTAGGTDSIGYTVTDQLGDSVTGTCSTQVDGGPTAGSLASTSKLGTTTDLTSALVAVDKAELAGDVLTLSAVSTTGTLDTVTLAGGKLTYGSSVAALQAAVAHGSTSDIFGYTVRDQLGETASGTVVLSVH